MNQIDINKVSSNYKFYYEAAIQGRRILWSDIEPLLLDLKDYFQIEEIGSSENGLPICKLSVGTGATKVFSWSQMHGNESTGTKALFDLFNFFKDPKDLVSLRDDLLNSLKMEFIILLNPDGAIAFTRENADGIDLNRDAVHQKAKESRLLRTHLDAFQPKFCFNLHDQRSIFNVEGTPNPATLSFLAPSEEVTRKLTSGRKETMKVISEMNLLLQTVIPNHIGRYTDEFYPTATGDNFQKLGYNTILIEAGHVMDDYERELTRKYNFIALLQGLLSVSHFKSVEGYERYFDIPNNDKQFLDIIYKDVKRPIEGGFETVDIGVQIKFKVENDTLNSYKSIEHIGQLSGFHSNSVISAENIDYNELKLSNS